MRRSGRSKWWFKSRKKDDAGDCIWVSPTLSFLLVFSWTSASALPDLWMQNSSHLLSHIQGWGLLRALQTFNMPPPCLLCFSLPASGPIYGFMRAQFSQCFQVFCSHCAVWFKDPMAHMNSLLFHLYGASRLLCKPPCLCTVITP